MEISALEQMHARSLVLDIRKMVERLGESCIGAETNSDTVSKFVHESTQDYFQLLQDRKALKSFSDMRTQTVIGARLIIDHVLVDLHVLDSEGKTTVEQDTVRKLKTRRGRVFKLSRFTPRRLARWATSRLIGNLNLTFNLQPVQPLNHLNITCKVENADQSE